MSVRSVAEFCTVLVLALVVLIRLAPAAVAIDRVVKVHLFAHSKVSTCTVTPPFAIVSPHSQMVVRGKPWTLSTERGQLVFGPGSGVMRGNQVVLQSSGAPLAITCGGVTHKIKGKVIARAGMLTGEIAAFDYVSAVVGSESLPEFGLEALKAQAVVVQSWLASRGPGLIGDDTSDMAFLGADYARPLCVEATRAVFGKVLAAPSGRVIKPYFHSTCAGKLSLAQEIFSGKLFYQDGKKIQASPLDCPYCVSSPFYRAHVERLDARRLISACGFTPLKVVLSDAAGRPLLVSVQKGDRVYDYSSYQLWLKVGQVFGWGAVPGMHYDFVRQGDHYAFTSRGAGHGIGLCQWGSQGMSSKGKTFSEILAFYFPGAKVR